MSPSLPPINNEDSDSLGSDSRSEPESPTASCIVSVSVGSIVAHDVAGGGGRSGGSTPATLSPASLGLVIAGGVVASLLLVAAIAVVRRRRQQDAKALDKQPLAGSKIEAPATQAQEQVSDVVGTSSDASGGTVTVVVVASGSTAVGGDQVRASPPHAPDTTTPPRALLALAVDGNDDGHGDDDGSTITLSAPPGSIDLPASVPLQASGDDVSRAAEPERATRSAPVTPTARRLPQQHGSGVASASLDSDSVSLPVSVNHTAASRAGAAPSTDDAVRRGPASGSADSEAETTSRLDESHGGAPARG